MLQKDNIDQSALLAFLQTQTTPIVEPGHLVQSPDGLGIGKVQNVDGSLVEVSFFHSVSHQATKNYHKSTLMRGYLSPQMRVFCKDNSDNWVVGRVRKFDILKDRTIEYEVQFPNKKYEYIHETEVYPRCENPEFDPTDVLASLGMETPFFYDSRRDISSYLNRFHAASRGLSGLLSSSIQLVPHQIDVVRRVLNDSVQRYLLSDEVGMGKTIEAGAIIRQNLIDDPNVKVAVIVPNQLVNQWETELCTKFSAFHFLGRLGVYSFDEVTSVAGDFNHIVIDEAHHLFTSDAEATSLTKEDRNAIIALAESAKGLLLLTATPVLGNEEILWRLLKLLAPENYKNLSLPQFRVIAEKRQELGRLLLGLNPEFKPLLLKRRANEAIERFEGDPHLVGFAEELISATQDGDRDSIYQKCMALRNFIASNYRLHHRLIRTRRSDTPDLFRPRGPSAEDGGFSLKHVVVEPDIGEQIEWIMESLEEWRYQAFVHADESEPELYKRSSIYEKFYNALACSSLVLKRQVNSYLESHHVSGSLFDGEKELLNELIGKIDSGSGPNEKIELLKLVLNNLKNKINGQNVPKILVFCDDQIEANEISESLRRHYSENEVWSYVDDSLHPDCPGEDEITNFTEGFKGDSTAWVFICDKSGEEGLNFHFADAIVHYDLPLSASRIEQRIGRLDRFGRLKDNIRHRILLPSDEDDSPWYAWYELLSESFQIFNSPISDIQFLLEALQKEIICELFKGGAPKIVDLKDDIAERIVKERERLDEQYALDQVTASLSEGLNILNDINEIEDYEDDFLKAFNFYLFKTLLFRRSPNDWQDEPFTFEINSRSLVPLFPWQQRFNAAISGDGLACKRHVARRKKSELVRPGHPLVTTLESFLKNDDRGTSYALWRFSNCWEQSNPWMGFKLCYVLQPDLETVEKYCTEKDISCPGIKRRLYSYLPPREFTVCIDSDGNQLVDEGLIGLLSKPYNQSNGDRNLSRSDRLCILLDLIPFKDFRESCLSVRSQSDKLVSTSDDYNNHISNAFKQVEVDLANKNADLNRKIVIYSAEGRGCTDLYQEVEINQLIENSIKNPHLKLDSMGFIILSNERIL